MRSPVRALHLALTVVALLAVPLIAHAETPDFGNDISSAKPLPSTQPVIGSLSFADNGDNDDVFSKKLKAGQWLWVQLRGDSGTDFDLYLFGPTAKSVMGVVPAVAKSERERTSMEFLRYKASVDTTIHVDVFAFNGKGGYKLTYGTPATGIAISVSAPSTREYAQSATIRGTVTERVGGKRVPNERVYLFQKPYGSAQYTYLADKWTASDGSYSFSVKPAKQTRYMVRHLGSAKYITPTTNPSFVITPKLYFSNHPYTSTSTMTYGKYYSVWGFFKPKHAVGSMQIKVRAYRKEKQADGTYKYVYRKTYRTRVVTHSSTSSYSKYKYSYVKLPKGKWRLRAVHEADSKNALTYSNTLHGWKYVTVK